MKHFEKHIERRDSCEALRYSDQSEAYWIATELFGSCQYCVLEDGRLSIKNVSLEFVHGSRDPDNNLLINRGDYIIKDLYCSPMYRVIPRSDFQRKWERA